jgi:predicted acetyltransferase
MAVEYRAVDPSEFDELLAIDTIGFGSSPRKPEMPDTWARGELDRTRAAFERGRIVGAGRNYTFEVTLPGGALLPAAAVSWISVLPSHRRRGVLTGTMRALHDDAREHEEPVAILTASESVIYGRFGYGISTWRLGIEVERAHARFVGDDVDTGSMRFVEDDESLKLFPPVYDLARRSRTGMVPRPEFWWPEVMWWIADDAAPTFRAVHEDADGNVDGYVFYGIGGPWERGISSKRLTVLDLVATSDAARSALWRFVFGVDLVHTVTAGSVPIDEPLRFMLDDPRRVRTSYVNDGMWLCILDEQAALAARTYAVEGRLTFEVHRPDGDVVTVQVDGGPHGATCRESTAAADIVLGTAQLSSAYLGGVTFAELHAAGRIDEASPDAIASADGLFATAPPPAMTSWF